MKINRRSFIIKSVLAFLGLFLFDIFWFEKYVIQWTTYDLSESDSKIKIIQLSDLHINELKTFHKSIASKINEELPDLICITGDAVNNNKGLPVLDQFLDLISKEIPKFVIMGNKEYAGKVNIDSFRTLIKKHNGQLMINESLKFTTANRHLNIIGIDDLIGGNPDFINATSAYDRSEEAIVLNHCPEYSDEIAFLNETQKVNIKLILSGHTHGGQITFLGKAFYKPGGSGRFLRGWYRLNDTRMYVSKGIGTKYIPIRMGSRAEATVFYV
ncbi:metallophosphoesterase [uncultured Eudoraea sp.]|uniref:metallophosphoesterase n=1 Tax=uncultured Eudoraea sp. TaxID=1035614 RepID=UPI002611A2BB|nr:metallophosphoesterase [uncultured Eudoraea sp.]